MERGPRYQSMTKCLVAIRDNERYMFFYDENSIGKVLRKLNDFAENEELNFTVYDALVLSQMIREENDQISLRN